MPERFPAPVYAETVLEPNFDDAKKYFLDYLLRIHIAHTRMLAAQSLISREEERILLAAVASLDRSKIEAARYDGSCEDLFFFIEGMLVEACGIDVAGKMHTARSRNDIAITLYRMAVRDQILSILRHLHALIAQLQILAERYSGAVMPAHTHTQPAQPTTLGHYLLAIHECLGRDAGRLQAAFTTVNRCPMGAAAITTTGFPIDRNLTATFLGFEGLAENSYGAIAAIDYMTETAGSMATLLVNVGKFTQDLLLWSTREFSFIRLSDAYVQTSSIMPQKRNPVPLEHVRILASRALGQAQGIFTTAHNTPFGDINDSEDDLQPLVFGMFADARKVLSLLAGVLSRVEIDQSELARRAGTNFLTVTELADTLVRECRTSFREAHGWVAAAVKACGNDDRPEAIADALFRAKPDLGIERSTVAAALDPVHFVTIRNIIGGPGPQAMQAALAKARHRQAELTTWIEGKTAFTSN